MSQQGNITALSDPAGAVNDAAFLGSTSAPPTLVFKPGAVFSNHGPVRQNVFTSPNVSGTDGLVLLQNILQGAGFFPTVPMPSSQLELDFSSNSDAFALTTNINLGTDCTLKGLVNQSNGVVPTLHTSTFTIVPLLEIRDLSVVAQATSGSTFTATPGSITFSGRTTVTSTGFPLYSVASGASMATLRDTATLGDGTHQVIAVTAGTLIINLFDGASLEAAAINRTGGAVIINSYSPGATIDPSYTGAPGFTINLHYSTASAPGYDFVFKPGGVATGNVAVTEAGLSTFLTGLYGARLLLDYSLAPTPGQYSWATVGALNLGTATIWDDDGADAKNTFAAGTALFAPPLLTGAVGFTITQVTALCTVSGPALVSINEEASVTAQAAPFVDVVSDGLLFAYGRDGSSIQGNGSVFALQAETGGTVVLYAEDGANVGASAVGGAGGAFVFGASSAVSVDPTLYPVFKIGGFYLDTSGGGVASISALSNEGAFLSDGTTGNFFTSNGAVWSLWQNNDGAVAIGDLTTSAGAQGAVAIGFGSTAAINGDVGIGNESVSTLGVALGNGSSAQGTGVQAVAIGTSCGSAGDGATAIGAACNADGNATVAIGLNSDGTDGVAIGNGASATGAGGGQAVAIGSLCNAGTAAGAVAIGDNAASSETGDVSIGESATAFGVGGGGAVAVGNNALATASGAVAIGDDVDAINSGDVCIGTDGEATGGGAVCIGIGYALAQGAVGIGNEALANRSGDVAIGNTCSAAGGGAAAIGNGASSFAQGAVAIGWTTTADSVGAVAIGNNVGCGGGGNPGDVAIGNAGDSNFGVAIGNDSEANGITVQAVAIGSSNSATGDGAVTIGDTNTTSFNGDIAIGLDNTASGGGAVAIGNTCAATQAGAVAIGDSCSGAAVGAVALGGSCSSAAVGDVAIGLDNEASGNGEGAFAGGNDNEVLGEGSVGIGAENFVGTDPTTTEGAVAIGGANSAVSTADVAIGLSCTAILGVAIGQAAFATGILTTAIALGAATSTGGIAIGDDTTTSQDEAVAVGINCTASAEGAAAIGVFCSALANGSFAAGETCTATGNASAVIGLACTAPLANQLVTGNSATGALFGERAHGAPGGGPSIAPPVVLRDVGMTGATAGAQTTLLLTLGDGASAFDLDSLIIGAAATAASVHFRVTLLGTAGTTGAQTYDQILNLYNPTGVAGAWTIAGTNVQQQFGSVALATWSVVATTDGHSLILTAATNGAAATFRGVGQFDYENV